MLRRNLLVAFALAVTAKADLLPERFGNYTRDALKPVTVTDRPVWDEYGFDTAEQWLRTNRDFASKVAGALQPQPTA